MSTQTQRQSSLRSLSEVTQIVRGAPLGQVDPVQVRQAAVRVAQGGGVQRRFRELRIPVPPSASFPAEGDEPAVVRGVIALLGQLDTISTDSLQPHGCGCISQQRQRWRHASSSPSTRC